MKNLLLCLLISVSLSAAGQPLPQGKWKPIFNGKNLKGWDIKIRGYALNDNFGNTFRVSDGKLQVGYEGYTRFNETFGHIFYRKPYSHYIVAAEYRFIGAQAPEGPDWAYRNSGIMVHSQAAATMGKDQDFPISIEVQLLGGYDDDRERTTANLCTPGTHVVMNGQLLEDHCVSSSSETYRGDQWVRVEVLVLGDSLIRHIVNGDTVLTYSKPQIGGGVVSGFDETVKQDGTLLTSGYISLQSESHPVEFRKVEIMDLSKYYRKPRKK
ncbi:MAG: DUF1080 domain-containing protein [Bacteroidia bacterium]|nr:DUF1080 domain-containing protein [Bacteroidia bacterium]